MGGFRNAGEHELESHGRCEQAIITRNCDNVACISPDIDSTETGPGLTSESGVGAQGVRQSWPNLGEICPPWEELAGCDLLAAEWVLRYNPSG